MLNKEILQAAFNQFTVRSAKFKTYTLYIINGTGFSFHISINHSPDDPILIEAYSNSARIWEAQVDGELHVISFLQGHIVQLSGTTWKLIKEPKINGYDVTRGETRRS